MTDEEYTRFDQMFRTMGEDPMMMYRAKSPFANNRDEFNDAMNYAPTENQQTFDLGTDDAGNPIIGSSLTDALEESAKPKKSGVWTNSINAAEVSERILADEEGGELNLDELISGGRTDLGQEIRDLHEKARDTSLYAQYMYSREDWAEKSKEIFDETGMDLDPFENKDVFEKAWNLTKEVKRQKALATDASGHVDMDKVCDAIPGFRDIQEAHGTAAAVMVMQSMKELQTINDIYQGEGERFLQSLKYGVMRGGLQLANQYTGAKAMFRGLVSNEGLNAQEINDILWVTNELRKMPQFSYSSAGSLLGGVLGSAAENAPIMLPEMARTAAVNLGKLTGPVGTAASAFVYALMSAQIGGAQYIENITKTDENGNPIYTPRQAALLSAAQGLAEGYLEKRSIAAAGKAVFNAGTAKRIAEIYAKKDAALAAGQSAEELTRQIVVDRIRHAAKAGFISIAAESEEEFEQQVSDMVLENIAQIAVRGDQADVSSMEDILSESFSAAVQAVPATVGFGLIGAGGSVVANTRELNQQILSARERFENAQASQYARNIYENERRNNITEEVRAATPEKLEKSAPDVYTEILDKKNEEENFVYTQVDLRALTADEKNKELVNTIIELSGATEEEVQECLRPDRSGMLNVKTSSLQRAQNITPEQQQVLNQHTAHNGKKTNYQIIEEAKRIRESLKAVEAKTDEEKKAAIENFAKGTFADDEATQKLAIEAISENPDNPALVVRSRMKANDEAISEILGPTIEGLKAEGGQGTSVVETLDKNGDVQTGRASNNPLWYQNFYADYGRAPTNADYERIAYENATGTATRYSTGEIGNLTPEDVAYFEATKAELDALFAERESLRKINAALDNVRTGEFLATASLSAEGREAYNELIGALGTVDNKKVRQAARAGAIFAARMAERVAQMWRDAGEKKTAKDVMPQVLEKLGAQVQDKSALNQTAGEKGQTEKADFSLDDIKQKLIKAHNELFNKNNADDMVKARDELLASETVNNINDDQFGGLSKDDQKELFRKMYQTVDEKGKRRPKTAKTKYGEEVIISVGGIFNELKHHNSDGQSMRLIPYLKNIIENSTFLFEGDPLEERKKKKDEFTKAYRHYACKVNIDGKPKYVRSVIRHATDGKYYYDAIIEDNDTNEKKASSQLATPDLESGGAMRKPFVSNRIISWWLSEINSYAENSPTILDTLNQSSERNLIAYHNTTEEALSQTIDSGIAMPSLAIVKKDIPFDNFGSITLVGNQNLVDPKRGTPVYSRDAYTTRMPRPEYAQASKKQLSAFEKAWKEKLKDIPGGEELVEKLLSDAKYYPENIEPNLKHSSELEYYYLTKVRGKDVQLFYTKPAYQNKLLAYEQKDIMAVLASDKTETEKRKKLKKPVIDILSLQIELIQDTIEHRRKQSESKAWFALFEKAEQRDKEKIAEYQKQIDDIKKHGISEALYDELQSDFDRVAEAEKQSKQIDWNRTRDNMPKENLDIIHGNEYQKFISDIDKQLRGEARVKVGRKYLPYTTENLVKAMLAHSGSAQEEWGGYSPARVAAAGSKQFSTLDEIRANKGKLVSEKEAEQVVVEVNLDLHDRFADARKYHKFLEENDFDLEEIFNEAVAKAIKGNRTATAANVKSAFRSMDFDVEKMPASLIADIVKAANHVKDAAAWYFEAKPQRAVDVGEFSAAVVPIGTSEELIQKLEAKGLTVKEYKGNVEGDRQRAIQELQEEKPDVLFQTSTHGTYSRQQNLVSLFENADQSTFMHEMSHFYLNQLAQIAAISPPDSQAAKDYATAKAWAEWHEGDAEAFKGTAAEEEFAYYEEKIKEAEKNGSAVMEDGTTKTKEQLLDMWEQEKFARGFEDYLRSGNAPSSLLQKIFRSFVNWLTKIYKDVVGVGVKPSAEVEAVMARMVATDEEIEMMATMRAAESIANVAPELLDENTAAMHARWSEEAKEEAKEKLRKELLKEWTERDVDAHMKDFEELEAERLRNDPAFEAELLVSEAGVSEEDAAKTTGYGSAEAWKKDLEEKGGSYEAALQKSLKAERDRFQREMIKDDALIELAEEAIVSTEYAERLAALEAEAIKRREKKYATAPRRLANALAKMETALDTENLYDPLKAAFRELRYAERWNEAQQKQIEEMQATIDELTEEKQELRNMASRQSLRNSEERKEAAEKAEADKEKLKARNEKSKAKLREKLKAQLQAFKDATAKNAEWLRGVRDAVKGNEKLYRQIAKDQLDNMSAADATNWRKYMEEARKASKESARHLANAVRKQNGTDKEDSGERDFELARQAKMREALFIAQAREAAKRKKELSRIVAHLKRREKALAKDKNIDASSRYYVNHLLYMMGFRKSDALVPMTLEGFSQHMNALKDRWSGEKGENNIGDLDVDFEVPSWLASMVESRDGMRQKLIPEKYTDYKMSEIEDLKTLVDILYKTARNRNRLLTMEKNIVEAVQEIMRDYQTTVTVEKGEEGISEFYSELLQPIVMLRTLGKAFVKYIYNPMFDGTEARTRMSAEAAETLNALFAKYWNKKERRAIRKKELDAELPDGTKLTKEMVLALALNWGNDGNRLRVLNGWTKEGQYYANEGTIEDIFRKYMTEKDWAFIQEAWDFINTFGDKVNEVMERSTGAPMKRVEPRSFVIKTADGEFVEVRGGYYPIAYDPEKSIDVSEQDLMTASKALGGASTFGTGMGSTKARSETGLQESPLLLSIDVLFRHVNQQIHIATMRLACRDAYKILTDSSVKAMVEQSLGMNAYRQLKRWVEANWNEPRMDGTIVDRWIERLRRNTVAAIMGFRMSTALLNLANPIYMAREMGALNALSSFVNFYRNRAANRAWCLEQSPFLRNRANNIDRDLNNTAKNSFAPSNPLEEVIQRTANRAIEETDMLCSLPAYYGTYQQTLNAELEKGATREDAEKAAHYAAEDVVRRIFGSSDTLDQSAIQRSKSAMTKAFTPFYTFAATQANAVFDRYMKARYQGSTRTMTDDGRIEVEKKNIFSRYELLVEALVLTYVVGPLAEQLLRELINKATGDDDKDKLTPEEFAKRWAAQSLSGATSGVPILNIFGELVGMKITGGSYPTRTFGIASAAIDRGTEAFNAAVKFAEGKKDWIDTGRTIAKGAGAYYGFPDTLTDAVFNAARALDIDASFQEWFMKSLFDRKLKAKKGR